MKNIFVTFITLLTIFIVSSSRAGGLKIRCTNKSSVETNIQTDILLQGSFANVAVSSNGNLIYSSVGEASYDETWDSVMVIATSVDELEGVKIYFESGRGINDAVALRPYGVTSKKLSPDSEGIIVYGLTCDQTYTTILNEVQN